MTMPTKITRVGALEAARAGGEAYRAGTTRTECPYEPGDLGDEYMAHYWMRGFRKAAEAQPAT
jgi:ribosome modulation factor